MNSSHIRPRSAAMTESSRLLHAALAAAEAGHYVLPLRPRTKIPALHGERACTRTGRCSAGHLGWERWATRDPRLIRRWWATPRNIGIATGPSGLHVLDLDAGRGHLAPEPWTGARHGRDVLAQLAAEAGEPYPGNTRTVRTPTGGLHLYFTAPPVPELRNTVARLGWRIDSRGYGGYIVAAGSVTGDGLYRVVVDSPIAPLPNWLVARLEPPPAPEPVPSPADLGPASERRRQAYLDTVCRRVVHATPGTRRATLLRAACSLGRLIAGGEFTDSEVRAALHDAAAQLSGVSGRDIENAIDDGIRYGSRSPRSLAD